MYACCIRLFHLASLYISTLTELDIHVRVIASGARYCVRVIDKWNERLPNMASRSTGRKVESRVRLARGSEEVK